jgi:hypothetical protein
MITQILYNTNIRHYDTMVTFLRFECTINGSTKLSLEDVKKAYRTVHESIKQNPREKKKLICLQELVDKKVTNQQIVMENQQIKTKVHPIGRVKIHQRRHN